MGLRPNDAARPLGLAGTWAWTPDVSGRGGLPPPLPVLALSVSRNRDPVPRPKKPG